MSIAVHLYSFTKRENSTKRPSSGASTYNCVLIDNTSLLEPTFKLDLGSNPIGKNYAYVPDFNRYYFITDISSYHDYWYITCTCDVMASFKTQIGAETHYVNRAASEYDEYISDNYYPTKVNEVGIRAVAPNPFSWTAGHSYVVGIIGYAPNAAKQTGSVTYYHMNEGALLAFIDYLMNNLTDYSGIALSDYEKGVQQALINPMQYIVSCIAVPVAPPSTRMNKIRFGYYEWTCSAGYVVALGIADAYATESTEINLIKHPQANTRGKYLNGSPYMSYLLHFGPFGDIPLDPADLIDVETIKIDLMYDMIKGTVRMLVHPKGDLSNNYLFTGCTQVGVNVNISQVVKDTLGQNHAFVNGITGIIGGMFHLNPFESASAAFNGIESGARLKYPTVSGLGEGGSFLSFFDDDSLFLMCKYYLLVDENLAEVGRPLCKPKQINTLSGYIQCENADCTISGTHDEAAKVNQYLNSGFFYE